MATASAAGGAAQDLLISGKRREWAGKVGGGPLHDEHGARREAR